MREPEESSGCAGAMVIAVIVTAPLAGLYLASRTAFVLTVWALAWGGLIMAARSKRGWVSDTSNHAPPASPERGSEQEPQISVVRDASHPNRWLVTRPSKWLGYSNDDRDES